jgi:threonine synthase
VPPSGWLTLGEGWTPAVEAPRLAERLGLERLVLKREDLNPTGSHKARGLAFQLAVARMELPPGSWVTISSSGNAAMAAAAYAALAQLRLAAFIAPATPPAKVASLVRLGATVFVTPRALSMAEELAISRRIPNLRPSTHAHAVEGFQSIGWEIVETLAPVEALFTFVSSGTSFVALGRALQRAGEVTARPWAPALHAVQGTGAQPIAGLFDRRRVSEVRGRLGALGARKTRRAGEAKRWILATGGSGWVITDEEAAAAGALLADHGLETSLEGAAALAAAHRAARAGLIRTAVVLLTGRPPAPAEVPPVDGGGEHLVHVFDLHQVEAVLDEAPAPVPPPLPPLVPEDDEGRFA